MISRRKYTMSPPRLSCSGKMVAYYTVDDVKAACDFGKGSKSEAGVGESGS